MHDINEEIIKKLISNKHPCSWMEIITTEDQSSKYFVSHNWAEPFRDFMHSLETHAAMNCLGIHDVFFVCTFANNQWKLDLGEKLCTAPFYEALQDSTFVILVLDKKATALERLWCIFEITSALTLDNKTLGIVTPLGPIGDKRIQSGPVLEALQGIDVVKANASNPADARQILNLIAGVEEEEGLTKTLEGKKVLAASAEAPCGSRFAYEYEETLVNANWERFETINTRIREFATKAIPRETPSGCTVDDVAFRAVSLAQLRAMVTKAKFYFFSEERKAWRAQNNVKSWMDIKTVNLMDPFLKEQATKAGKSSYMETVSAGKQKPEFVVTCAFLTKAADLLASIEWHAEARDLPDSALYWIIGTAALKEEVDDYIAANRRPPSFEAMPWSEGMVCVLDEKASLLTRALPAVEVYDALSQKKMLDLVCPTGALATTRPFKEGWEFGNFDPGIAKYMIDYDVKKIMGTKIGDLDHAEMVKCMIAGVEYTPGTKAPEQSANYEAFSERIRSKALGPVLREAAYDGDFDKVREVLSHQLGKVSMDSHALCGHSGEGPMHAAAAGGHDDIVQQLFLQQASPNAQDLDGETPLHYAALGGRDSTVKVLLRMGADPNIESYFGETAATVAIQNPAFFFNVDTAGVEHELKKWTKQKAISDLQVKNAALRGKIFATEDQIASLKEDLAQAKLQNKFFQQSAGARVDGDKFAPEPREQQLAEESIDTLTKIFDRYDSAGTGMIEVTHMEAIFRQLNYDVTGSLRVMCTQAGTFTDGKICYRDFLKWVFHSMPTASR